MLIKLYKEKIRKIMKGIIISFRKKQAKKLNINFFEPNYIYIDKFNSSSIIIDVGCGFDADFSVFMSRKYNLRSFGIDPTRKHADSLKLLSKKTNEKFQYFPFAVTSQNKMILFYESLENVSGSILQNHTNVKNDTISSYEVECVTPGMLLSRLGLLRVDFIKLDLEGAEYELISNTDAKTLEKFDQIFVEFHHHCINSYSKKDTKNAVKFIVNKGFKAFTLDGHNYLFYKD